MNKKILITGGSGFVGQNIIDYLQKKNKKLIIYNLSKTAINKSGIINITEDAKKINFQKINIQFDYIINALALSNDQYCKNLKQAEEININFTNKLLKFSQKQKKLKKFIHISSIILYDNNNRPPVKENGQLFINYNNYSFTKGVAESYVDYYLNKFKIPIIIFRLSNIYGPHQNMKNSPFLIPSKIKQAVEEQKINVFNLNPKRDWIYAADAAEAIVKALKVSYTGILNLGSGQGISVKNIIKEIAAKLKVNYYSLNRPVVGPLNFYCDIRKTKDVLNWEPKTNIKNGIKKTIDYLNKNL